MPAPTREAIYAAIFALISSAAEFKTKSRFLRHWSEVDVNEMPAIFMTQDGELPIWANAGSETGVPPVWSLDVSFFIYAGIGEGESTPPAKLLNPLVDAILAALKPSTPNGRQTLGGLVHHARVSGRIETDEGLFGTKTVAIVPVRALTAEL
jgi:hypothetical protein